MRLNCQFSSLERMPLPTLLLLRVTCDWINIAHANVEAYLVTLLTLAMSSLEKAASIKIGSGLRGRPVKIVMHFGEHINVVPARLNYFSIVHCNWNWKHVKLARVRTHIKTQNIIHTLYVRIPLNAPSLRAKHCCSNQFRSGTTSNFVFHFDIRNGMIKFLRSFACLYSVTYQSGSVFVSMLTVMVSEYENVRACACWITFLLYVCMLDWI